MTRHPCTAALLALMLASPAMAGQAPDPEAAPAAREAAIPFLGSESINDYRVEGRDTLYIQDIRGRWYKAELMGNCLDLDLAEVIGFDTGGTSSFDRFSTIVVRGRRCPLKSLVASPAPPPARGKTHAHHHGGKAPQSDPPEDDQG